MLVIRSRNVNIPIVYAVVFSNNVIIGIRKDWLFKVGIFLLGHSQQSFPFIVQF